MRDILKLLKSHAAISFLIIVFGITVRIYLAITLPIWHDEAYSLWAATQSTARLLSGVVDPVHPPGYYLIIKVLTQISDHLWWIRLSSIAAFTLNCMLILKLFSKSKLTSATLVLTCYVFSGYFIIFDWQVRMYTLILTLILLSQLRLMQSPTNLKDWAIITVINALGLYIDYAFFWYFIPLALYSTYKSIFIPSRRNYYQLGSVLCSSAFFLCIYPSIFTLAGTGIGGIEWMREYLSPAFFIPYFLGTPDAIIPMITISWLCIIGAWRLTQIADEKLRRIILFAVFSLIFTLLVSFYKPLFHVRSLQIVGLASTILISCGVSFLDKNISRKLAAVALIVIIGNFIWVSTHLYSFSSHYLLQFFPWKEVRKNIEVANPSETLLYPTIKPPTPLLQWGFAYTLAGKETIFSQPLQYHFISTPTQTPVCTATTIPYFLMYTCK